METFVWDHHFTTGIAAIDNQHRKLVDLINRLGDYLMVGQGPNEAGFQAAFDQLADYARQHFHDEEQLMADAGISARHCAEHRQQHADFAAQLGRMWAARRSTPEPAAVLHGFLSAWLAMHILGEDKTMARQIEAVRAGASPDEALAREMSPGDNATETLVNAIQSLYRVMARQNTGLVQANQTLEDRVLERTQALALANAALQALNARLDKLSNLDGLLGIANRRCFDERLDLEWRRAARTHQPLSLLMIDVDHFKRYNDHYGHPAGDHCLQAVARASAAGIARRPADLLARYGGEELVVLLPDTPGEGGMKLAREIQLAIADLHLPHADSPVAACVTVSIGVATLQPRTGNEPGALVSAADAALYSAKATGRDRVVEHVPA